jgi:hypothetical protein
MDNNLESQFSLPSRSELGAIAMFGATEEERDLARRLFAVVPEEKDPEHPLITLNRLFPVGSPADEAAKNSPKGRFIEDLINSIPEELGQPDPYETIKAELPVASVAKAPEPEPELLGESMKKLTGRAQDIPAPVVEQPRQVYTVKPPPEQDFGRNPI